MTPAAALRSRFADRPVPGALLGAALATASLVVTLVMLAHGGMFPAQPDPGVLDAESVALAACSTLPLILWQRPGLGVFIACAASGAALAGLGYPADLLVGAAAALYLLTAHREAPLPHPAAAVVIGLFAAYLSAAWFATGAFPDSELLHTGLAWSAAWFAGERTRLRRQHLDDLRQRMVRAERDAERERLLAVAEERTRIARDLHDSAAHAISVIAVRAGAARLRDDPETSRRVLEAVETLARQTAEEIDQLVATLREDHDALAPAGLGSLGTLIARQAATGLDVELKKSGEPRPLGAVVDQAAYRILQEALANAARHGTGSARVDLVYGPDGVEFAVANPIGGQRDSRPEGGHGLIGMRERAELLGGRFDAGGVGGVFEVRAAIPDGGRRG